MMAGLSSLTAVFYEQFDLDQVRLFVGFAFPSARTFAHRN
jgi:hypothetical protein